MRETRDIEMTPTLESPADVVSHAVTSGEGLAKWFAPEARVDLRPGGSVFVSWGDGMEVEVPIEVVEARRHFRDRFGESGPNAAALFVDFHLARAGNRTKLRMVHSGFGTEAKWDEECDAHVRGWTIFLVNLRHLVERHVADACKQTSFSRRIAQSRATVWRWFLAMLDTTGALEAVAPGARYALTTASGDRLTGEVEIVTPARDLAVKVDDAGLREGVRHRIVAEEDGERVEMIAEFSRVERPSKIAMTLHSVGGGDAFEEVAVYDLVEDAGVTTLTFSTKSSYHGAVALLEPLITSSAQRKIEGDLARLKRNVETEAL